MPPLLPLHPDESLSPAKLAKFRKAGSQRLIDSLRPGQVEALRVRPDGTVINGNHRLKILRERGVDVNALPREILAKDSPH